MIGRRLFFGLLAAAPVAAAKAMENGAAEVAPPSPVPPRFDDLDDDFNPIAKAEKSELERDYWWARDTLEEARWLLVAETNNLPYHVTVPRSWSGAFRRHVAAQTFIERERQKRRDIGQEVTERIKRALVKRMMGG